MTVVVDANVLLSAISSPLGTCAKVVEAIAGRGMILSSALIDEVERGFDKPYFASKMPRREMEETWRVVRNAASIREIGDLPNVETDPNDLHVLALARDGRADAIITGDKRLLALDPWEGVRILRPGEFLSTFGVD